MTTRNDRANAWLGVIPFEYRRFLRLRSVNDDRFPFVFFDQRYWFFESSG